MQTQYQHQIVESLSFFIAPFIAKPKLLHYLPSVLLLISEKSGNCLDVANIMSVGVVVLVCQKNPQNQIRQTSLYMEYGFPQKLYLDFLPRFRGRAGSFLYHYCEIPSTYPYSPIQ